jgi:hypothetical protein
MLGYDLLGFIVLLFAVWALDGILASDARPTEMLAWSTIVLVFPFVGFIVWYLAGPGTKTFPLSQ